MIFVTLGSQRFQFNRLLKYIDELVDSDGIEEEVFAQVGYSDYIPKNYSFEQFLDRDEFKINIEKANIIITHAGTGAIITGLKNKKNVIAVPRLAMYGEHIDDHQLQIVDNFTKKNYIMSAQNAESIRESIILVKKGVTREKFKSNNLFFLRSLEKLIN
ncbi:PssE/Cps14G family polysaccharide biosynthesis glycosyltransferase [Enterococcus sp. CSURQ0835]|uniref:PssE/Cps14G family polysaccharide biosynthesis glycosyltransferase n=1 Tax=Enterococcus sp. CSURQ0835 TaxID=2681394 RepID=UPI00135BD66D|nr:PssE/Cps14G family polysaccharide biosynthesis glycosyltransferase [Enterococcus sp. CSURQ0835]